MMGRARRQNFLADPLEDSQHLKDRLNLDGSAGGELGEAEGTAGVVAVAFFAKDLVEEIGATVDDEMLVGVVERGIDAAEHFDDLQSIERAVCVPDGAEDLFGAVLGSCIPLIGGDICAEFALQITDMPGGDQLIATADAEIEVGWGCFFELDAEGFCFGLGCHD